MVSPESWSGLSRMKTPLDSSENTKWVTWFMVMRRYLDYQTGEAKIVWVGDIEASIVGVLSFVLQPEVHHHPPPVSLQHPQRSLHLSFTEVSAESPTRLNRLRTELTGGREREGQSESQVQVYCFPSSRCVKYSKSVSSSECHLRSSHQVSHALQCQVRDAAVILVTPIPEGQLATETSFAKSKSLSILPFPFPYED